tara:strand:+ start:132 stop:554 length:423 start_codon:yes stop_codon:yes gene_type:complete
MGKLDSKYMMRKKEELWSLLANHTSPHVLNVYTGEMGFILPYMKVSIEGGDLNTVYTDSDLYPDIVDQDIDLIIKKGVLEGVRIIAMQRSWKKLKALREQMYLNKARGAFKKYQEKELEITKLLMRMRVWKHTNKMILQK